MVSNSDILLVTGSGSNTTSTTGNFVSDITNSTFYDDSDVCIYDTSLFLDMIEECEEKLQQEEAYEYRLQFEQQEWKKVRALFELKEKHKLKIINQTNFQLAFKDNIKKLYSSRQNIGLRNFRKIE